MKFSTKNRIKSSQNVTSTRIGVQNLERRLNLLCPDRATLEWQEEGGYFYTHLVIQASSTQKNA